MVLTGRRLRAAVAAGASRDEITAAATQARRDFLNSSLSGSRGAQ